MIILKSALPSLRKKIELLNLKLEQKGLAPVTFEVSDPFTRALVAVTRDGDEYSVPVTVVPVAMDAPFVELEPGWRVAGTARFDDEAEVWQAQFVEGEAIDPVKIDGQQCDHCGVRHERKKIHFLKHEGGELKQVGGTCAQDYRGHDLHVIGNMISQYHANLLTMDVEDEEPLESPEVQRLLTEDPVSIMAQAFKVIAEHGYMSRKQADDMNARGQIGVCTGGILSDLATRRLAEADRLKAIEDYSELASKALEYWASINADSQFQMNCRALATRQVGSLQRAGMYAWMAHDYLRKHPGTADSAGIMGYSSNQDITQKDRQALVGSEGERLRDRNVRIVRINVGENRFGMVYKTWMIDEETDAWLFWKASRSPLPAGLGGQLYDKPIDVPAVVTGTVKGHVMSDAVGNITERTFTSITRCKLEVVDATEAA